MADCKSSGDAVLLSSGNRNARPTLVATLNKRIKNSVAFDGGLEQSEPSGDEKTQMCKRREKEEGRKT